MNERKYNSSQYVKLEEVMEMTNLSEEGIWRRVDLKQMAPPHSHVGGKAVWWAADLHGTF
jgi:predicted DNA-binding transcriptional regulator AlpA